MVDDLVHGVVHVLDLAVGQLDPRQVLDRDATELVRRDPELPHVPRVDRDTAVRGARADDDLEHGVDRMDVDVGGHRARRRSFASVCPAASAQSSPKRSVSCARDASRAEDVGDLDVVGAEDARPPRRAARASRPRRGGARRPGRGTSPSGTRPRDGASPLSSKTRFISCEAPGLEHVLEVGVPDAEAAEADPSGLDAAVGPVEEAPLAADVHLDRARDRPVERNQLDLLAAPSSSLLLPVVEPASKPPAPHVRTRDGDAPARASGPSQPCARLSRRRSGW